MSKNDGGPAFPYAYGEWKGMSLRDWFAGQALAGLAANPNAPSDTTAGAFARSAWQLADAMLAEREKQ